LRKTFRGLALLFALGILPGPSASAQENGLRSRIRERFMEKAGKANHDTQGQFTKCRLAGLDLAVWKPEKAEKSPLVIFSHGFGGNSTQSAFLMRAMAKAGYLVIAPNHQDANGAKETNMRPEISFAKNKEWSEKTYAGRRQDIVNLIEALHEDPAWDKQIDWSKLALCGHSLGGYTVLGLAGAWPSWKLDGVKAVIGLSPFVTPYTASGNLGSLNVPVMYQGGTRDWGITPFVKGPQGAFNQTGSPAYFINFSNFNHLTWSGFNQDPEKQDEIDYYCIAFLDKYLLGVDDTRLKKKLPDVTELVMK
jgi:dienelactone hydrolase